MRGLRAAALPLAFLLLSLDSASPRPPAPPPAVVPDGAAAAALLPGRSQGRFGRPGDPLGLVFVGAPETVRAALREAGWTEVPFATRDSLAAGLAEWLAGRPVAAFPPMNEYRLGGRVQDMNWALPTRFLSARHHFRLWDAGYRDARGRTVWWGSGNEDLSIRWRDLSHVPDPDADEERDFVAASLAGSPRVERAELVALPQVPRAGANDKGYAFRTDGRAAVVTFVSAGPSGPRPGSP